MLRLLSSELFRLSRRLMPRVLLLLLAGLLVLLYLLFWTAIREQATGLTEQQRRDLRDGLRVAAVREFGLALVGQMGTIMAVILAASSVGSEYSWGTIRTILPRASGRAAFLTAKLITLVLFIVLIVMLGFLVVFAASALITATQGLDRDLGDRFVLYTLAALVRTMYIMLPYVAIAVATAVWTHSSGAGIGVGLAILVVEGPLTGAIGRAGGVWEWVPRLLIGANTQAVMNANALDPARAAAQAPFDLLNPWAAALVLALYTVGPLLIAFRRFQRRDITTG